MIITSRYASIETESTGRAAGLTFEYSALKVTNKSKKPR
jgi:hypothetical protein